jgi:NAD(P)-dependent dehydrogenase (short-subunit alcohol dehydrogenase family)
VFAGEHAPRVRPRRQSARGATRRRTAVVVSSRTLGGRRILIVGASSGIGQALARQAAAEGARVAAVARRADKLDETIAGAANVTPIVADLRRNDDCTRIAAETVAAIGSPELVFVSAGSSSLNWVHETSPEDWARAFETNVIGINLLFAALRPHLAPGTIVAACSSESVGAPRAGLVPYTASKAALEESLRGWRNEHPDLRFARIGLGATMPTGFADGWDPERLLAALQRWSADGLGQAEMMHVDDVAEFLAGTFAAALALPGVGMEDIMLRSPSKPGATVEEVAAWAADHGGPDLPTGELA